MKSAKLSPYIERYREAVERLTTLKLRQKAAREMGLNHRKTEKDVIDRGVPKSLAFRMAVMPYLSVAPELAKLAAKSGCAIEQAAVFFKLGDRMGLNMIRERARSMAARYAASTRRGEPSARRFACHPTFIDGEKSSAWPGRAGQNRPSRRSSFPVVYKRGGTSRVLRRPHRRNSGRRAPSIWPY